MTYGYKTQKPEAGSNSIFHNKYLTQLILTPTDTNFLSYTQLVQCTQRYTVYQYDETRTGIDVLIEIFKVHTGFPTEQDKQRTKIKNCDAGRNQFLKR